MQLEGWEEERGAEAVTARAARKGTGGGGERERETRARERERERERALVASRRDTSAIRQYCAYVYESRARAVAIRGARTHARTLGKVRQDKAGYCCMTIVRVGKRSKEGGRERRRGH